MASTDLYVEYLKREGYRPEVRDGLVAFRYEGGNYSIWVDDNDPTYFQLVYPNFWRIESDKERQTAIQCAEEATMKCKVAKVYVRPDGKDVMADIEEFLPRREDFEQIFDRALRALHTAVGLFVDGMKGR